MHNKALTFFERINKEPPLLSNFYPIYNKARKDLKPLSGYIYEFPIKQVCQYDKFKTGNISMCLTLNSDQFIKLFE